ncbi:MAG: hypothetical protein ABIJ45_10110 [Candidatus Zixiibacteriota bacterium]
MKTAVILILTGILLATIGWEFLGLIVGLIGGFIGVVVGILGAVFGIVIVIGAILLPLAIIGIIIFGLFSVIKAVLC